MVLPREHIIQRLRSSPPLLEDYLDLEAQLQPNGFDLTLKSVSRFASQGALGPEPSDRAISQHETIPVKPREPLELGPGPYLVTFNEVVNLPLDLMALGKPRSSLLRCGVGVHNAVWEAGYRGRSQALMVVYNPHGYRLALGARVMQLVFFTLDSPVAQGYAGVFQGENLAQGTG